MSDLPATAPDDVLAAAEEIQERSIQERAMDLVPDAIKTLGKFAKGQKIGRGGVKPPPSVIRASARDILEMAGGRPETRDPNTADGGAKVEVLIQQFSTGAIVNQVYGGDQQPELDKGEQALLNAERAHELPEMRDVSKVYDVEAVPVDDEV